MIKNWSLRIVWGLVGLCVALAWGELITRVFYPQNVDTILDILQADPVCGYIYEPHASIAERGRGYDVPFETNGLGLREREIAAKRDGVLRVLVIGNSFAVSHGVPVDLSFARAIETALNRRAAEFRGYRAVETVSVANAGYNTYNYRMAYERWKDEIDPDLVVVGFVPDREYITDPEGTRYVVENGLLTGRFAPGQTPHGAGRDPLQAVRKNLARNSHLYVLMRNFFYYNDRIDRVLQRSGGGDSALRSLRPYLVDLPGGVDKGWQRAFDHMRALRDAIRADGRGLIIAAIPSVDEVDPRHLDGLRAKAGLLPGQIDAEQPVRRLADFCRDEGIPLAEMGPAVARANAAEPAFLFDNHWNARGIAAGADALADRMRELGLPPFAPGGGS